MTPINSGRRRPKRSDIGPATSCPSASPSRQAVMVSCAVDVADRSSLVSAGRTGRYRSIEIGPKTVSRLITTARARPTVCWRVVGLVRRVLGELTGVLLVGGAVLASAGGRAPADPR